MFNNYYNQKNKYSNQKVTIDGEKFDSKKEAKRYYELKLLESAREIVNLRRQEEFILIPAQFEKIPNPNGKIKQKCIERKCSYIADFVYQDSNGNLIVEDTKGVRTKDYIIKRKLMLSIYNIKIKEI